MTTNDKKYTVYMHTSPSGKKYIGITSQKTNKRWKNDGSGYKEQPYFWSAICKYGWDNFKHEIILTNMPFEAVCEMEKYLIQYYKTYDGEYGYNLTLGGEGRFLTDEQKKELSAQRQGKRKTIKTCKTKEEAIEAYFAYLNNQLKENEYGN